MVYQQNENGAALMATNSQPPYVQQKRGAGYYPGPPAGGKFQNAGYGVSGGFGRGAPGARFKRYNDADYHLPENLRANVANRADAPRTETHTTEKKSKATGDG